MGEIDTKPIKPVQMALSLLGEKASYHRKNWSNGSDDEKERELESVLKDLASHKVQLEAKEAAHIQALLSLDQSQQLAEELGSLLKDPRDSEIKALKRAEIAESDSNKEREEREELENRAEMVESELTKEREERKELKKRVEMAESELTKEREEREELEKRVKMAEMDLISEREELEELKKQTEIVESDLTKEREERKELEKLVEIAERDLNRERERALELTDALLVSEKEKKATLSEKDAEIESAKTKIRRENEEIMKLESHLLSMTILSDTLRLQLREASDRLSFLQDELQIRDRKIFSQAALIEAYKIETNELKSAKELTPCEVNREAEDLRKELEVASAKVAEFRNRSEQANSRAEAAERAKSAIEDQLRKWREERQRKKKKFDLTPTRELVSEPRGTEISSAHYQPLYKILNMKF